MHSRVGTTMSYGGLLLNTATHEVDIQGDRFIMPGRMFDVLVLLFQHFGKGVSAEDMKRCLWPDEVISDEYLETLVMDLKKTLGPHSRLVHIGHEGQCYMLNDPYLKRLHGLVPSRWPQSNADYIEYFHVKECPFCRIQWGKFADQVVHCPHCGLQPGPTKEAGQAELEQWADEANDHIVNLWNMGCRALAISYWRKAVSCHPGHLAVQFNLGFTLWRDGHQNADMLVNTMQNLEKQYSSHPWYWRCLAWIHFLQGNQEKWSAIQASSHRVSDPRLLQVLADENRPLFKLHCHIQKGPGEIERIYILSPDGSQLISFATEDRGFDLWDLVKGESIHCAAETGGAVTSAAFSSDGLFIAAGSQNGMIRLWSKFGQEISLFHKHSGPVEELRFLPDDQSFISVGGDGEVRRWWLDQEKGYSLLARFRMGVESLAISSDGRGLFVLGDGAINKAKMMAYDLEKAEAFWVYDGSGKSPSEWEQSDSFTFALDRRVLVGRSTNENKIRTWNFYTGGDLREISYPDNEQLTHLQVIPGNDWYLVLASSCRNPEGELLSFLRIWNVGRSWLIADVHTHQDRITAIGLDEGGDLVATGGADGSIVLWRVMDGVRLKSFSRHEGKVLSAAVSPNGRFLLSYGEDGVVRLWDAETGCNLSQFTIPESRRLESGRVGFTWNSRYAYYIGSDVYFFEFNYPAGDWEDAIPHPILSTKSP